MQTVRQQPGFCCTICRSSRLALFSTSTPRPREPPKPKSSFHIERDIRRGEKADRSADQLLASGRWDKIKEPYRTRRDNIEREQSGSHSWGSRPRRQDSLLPVVRRPKNFDTKLKKATDFASYGEALEDALSELEKTLHHDPIFARLELEPGHLDEALKTWSGKLRRCVETKRSSDPTHFRFTQLWPTCNHGIFKLYVKYSFYGKAMPANFNKSDRQDHAELANLRYPTEWFPATRGFQREFHLHVGPTNSGKTYHALKRLEQAKTGLYAGPLRLLAHEVFMRLNAAGARCNLVTGDERRTADDEPTAPMTSCTVEMVNLNTKMDVAVIDEIQMIGSEDRGWAWTQAVLGVMAKEVHCCGEERAVPIMQELVAMCGEKLIVHRYKRLTPLQMAYSSLGGNLRKLQKGDCLVCFRIMEIHALRQLVEKTLRVKVAVIYGSLPPETRAQQAKLFNDPDSGYDILIASNAIGMGLNLSIKRLVFQTSQKFDGTKWATLTVAETKQIGGRAGRYSTAEQDMKKIADSNLDIAFPIATQTMSAASTQTPTKKPPPPPGLVTTLEKLDFPIIERLMNSEPEPLKSAGIQPPASIVERFAKYFPPGTPFAYVLMKLHEISETSARFFVCDLRQQLAIADIIEVVEGLTTTDRLIFCAAPIEARKPGEPELARAYARLVAENRVASIVDVEELNLDLLDDNYVTNRGYLAKLESLHKGVIIWNWLSFRFAGVFINRELSQHVKELVEARIEEVLQRLSFDYDKMRAYREQAVLNLLQRNAEGKEQEDDDGEAEQDEEVDSEELEYEEEGCTRRTDGEVTDVETADARLSDDYSNNTRVEEDVTSLADHAITPDVSEPNAADFDEGLLEEPDLVAIKQEENQSSKDTSPEQPHGESQSANTTTHSLPYPEIPEAPYASEEKRASSSGR